MGLRQQWPAWARRREGPVQTNTSAVVRRSIDPYQARILWRSPYDRGRRGWQCVWIRLDASWTAWSGRDCTWRSGHCVSQAARDSSGSSDSECRCGRATYVVSNHNDVSGQVRYGNPFQSMRLADFMHINTRNSIRTAVGRWRRMCIVQSGAHCLRMRQYKLHVLGQRISKSHIALVERRRYLECQLQHLGWR
jgi:hypothetical protein